MLLRLQLLVQVLYVVHEVQKDLLLAEESLAVVHRASHCRLPCWLSLQHLFDSEDLICTDQDNLEVPQRIVFVHKIQVVHVHRSSEFFVQVVQNTRHHGRVLYLASYMNGLFAHFKLTLLHKVNSVYWLTLTENYLLSLESYYLLAILRNLAKFLLANVFQYSKRSEKLVRLNFLLPRSLPKDGFIVLSVHAGKNTVGFALDRGISEIIMS